MNHILLLDLSGDAQRCVTTAIQADPKVRLTMAPTRDLEAELNRTPWSVVLASLSDQNREQGLRAVKFCQDCQIPCIAVVDQSCNSELRLAAYESGALDCVTLPGQTARMRLKVSLCLARTTVLTEELTRTLERDNGTDSLFNPIELSGLLLRLTRVAPLSSTILLDGETGVGKTTIAKWIHNQSPRRKHPFSVVSCAAIPATLLENELFGHTRGAFTSADQDCDGQFAAAGQGTLLLDEIDSLPLEVQGKLLRVVENRDYTPVGAAKSRRFEARLIAATNKNLQAEVESGRFRADLYYRLCIMSFRVPALRERPSAIVPLAEEYCRKFAREYDRPVKGLSPEVARLLEQSPWPGNIRELRNCMDYAVAMASGCHVQINDLPPRIAMPQPLPTPDEVELSAHGDRDGASALQTVRNRAERSAVAESLRRNGQNKSRAARDLGISRAALYKRLARLGLTSDDSEQAASRAFA